MEYVGKQMKKLHEEIGSLRADMNVQVGIAKGEIALIKKGESDAA